jgi:hypothetical protein
VTEGALDLGDNGVIHIVQPLHLFFQRVHFVFKRTGFFFFFWGLAEIIL